MSPIYPSPMADFGYDVADYTAVDPVFGTSPSSTRWSRTRTRGLDVLMDIVPCHTSIEHPWFREHPDWYIWADRAAEQLVAAFGGSAWTRARRALLPALVLSRAARPRLAQPRGRGRDAGRAALLARARRGRLPHRRHRPAAQGPAAARRPAGLRAVRLPLREDEAKLALSNSRNAPDTGAALAKIREAGGDAFLVGEVYLPSARWQPYSDYFDAVFAFELLHSPWDARCCGRRSRPARARRRGLGAVEPRLRAAVTRFGDENARAAAMLLLTLPGPAFLYQGDEIGQGEGPPGERRFDRAGRDRHRHPMQWDASPRAASPPASPGCRWWTRPSATSPTSATIPPRCSRWCAS